MQWFATADLAAAVSNAGGLGVISSATFASPGDLRTEIKRCKDLTDKPFAVNISLFPSLNAVGYHEHIKVCAEEGVRIMETAGRAPTEYIEEMKAAGMIVIHKCVAVKHALKAQSIGCDMVVIDGYEAAGHIGAFNTGTTVLTPSAVRALSIPVITAGGVCDGRSMAAALMLGAEGVYMGTRFVLNSLMKEVAALEAAGEPFEKVAPLVAGYRTRKFTQGGKDLDEGSLCIGEDIGLIRDVPSVEELISGMMAECEAQLGRFN